MDKAKFKMIDEGFVCEVCGRAVSPLGYTARDHCPGCLCSKHVDVNPGDRGSGCRGVLRPIRVDMEKGEYKIVYRCDRCGIIKRNKAASDDDFDMIVKVMANGV